MKRRIEDQRTRKQSSNFDLFYPSVTHATNSSIAASNPTTSSSEAVLAAPASSSPAPARGTKQKVMSGLKTFMGTIDKGGEAFGPLKLGMGELLECLNMYEGYAENQKEFERLEAELDALVITLDEQFSRAVPPQMTASIANLSNGIRKEAEYVRDKCNRNKTKRYVEAMGDGEDILNCYRRMQRLLSQISINVNLEMWRIMDIQLAEARLRGMKISEPARYNSSESTGLLRGKCTPNTRRNVISGLHTWADDPNGLNAYWLNGMAGTGKTTIAYSFCAEREETHSLGASFFCSRSSTASSDATLIVPTIAYQLAIFSFPFRSVLCKLLGDELDVCNRDVTTQFQRMIVDTLSKTCESVPRNTVVVIDALDECSNQREVGLFLAALLEFSPHLPIRFFISSRAEGATYSQMMREPKHRSILYLHEIEESFVQQDIELYVTEALYPMSPSLEQISRVVNQAGRLFIYAATVIRYVKADDLEFDDYSSERLEELLELSGRVDGIDELYKAILSAALDKPSLRQRQKEDMLDGLHTAVCAQEPLTVEALGALLRPKTPMVLRTALQPFRSVLHISDDTGLVTTLHASFPDYLFDRDRSERFYCNQRGRHGQFARLCFQRIWAVEPSFNICGLESSYDLDKQVDDLPERARQMIPVDLFYVSRYWAAHLEHSDGAQDLEQLLLDFLSARLLLWMEILNLKQSIRTGAQVLFQAERWCRERCCTGEAIPLLQDAYKFVSIFSNSPASTSTPHIYVSALALWPPDSPISAHYLKQLHGLVEASGTAMAGNTSPLITKWSAGSLVVSVAVSPSATCIAAGTTDNAVTVWDAHTGLKVLGPLGGHTARVNSVGFSFDGARIVSGSDDETICVWDASTGQLALGPLKAHSGSVNSVAYSPDGAYIISGSLEETIHLWNASTGHIACTLKGPRGTTGLRSVSYSATDNGALVASVCDGKIQIWDLRTGQIMHDSFQTDSNLEYATTVAYSPDGENMASGHSRGTVYIWDARTWRRLVGPLNMHTQAVLQVAYSPDGTCLASCAEDSTICICDWRSGEQVAGPFIEHTRWVNSIAYSPDGSRLISGSTDRTICIWDTRVRKDRRRLTDRHTGPVASVTYSHDGARIASGSLDRTISVWDADTGQRIIGPLQGHENQVASVAYSPDDLRIVSGSHDRTLMIWDAHTGKTVMDPLRGHTNFVTSVAYFPDGTRILSGSYDRTLKVWDSYSGKLILGPLRGHADGVTSVACSPDCAFFASGSDDRTIRLWDTSTGSVVRIFRGHSDEVRSIAYSPDGHHIASGSMDKSICIWGAQTGRLDVGPIKGHTRPVQAVSYSPDGARIASSAADGTIRLWDSSTGDLIPVPLGGHNSSIWSIAYSPGGARIVSCSEDGTIRVWCPDQLTHGRRAEWEFTSDGWVTDNLDHRLIWVPPALRAALMMPGETLHLSSHGSFSLNFNNAHLGHSWAAVNFCQ